MWVIKAKGQTYYIKHLTANISFSTKESPTNPHTKGSIKFKNCNILINDDLEATISESN
jgi:hypothetical protein